MKSHEHLTQRQELIRPRSDHSRRPPGIDELLLEASGIREFQYIEIYNVMSGERSTTYVVGDLLIIAAYASYTESEVLEYRPVIVLVDEHNKVKA